MVSFVHQLKGALLGLPQLQAGLHIHFGSSFFSR